MMRFFPVPSAVKLFYPVNTCWEMGQQHKKIYLTFDDGPCEESTGPILELLDRFRIRATFFCTGMQALKHSELFNKIIDCGHTIGNHTFSHKSAWKCTPKGYLEDFERFENEVRKTRLFRPPYGHFPMGGTKRIRMSHAVIMWSLMAWDFDPAIRPEKIVEIFSKKTSNGSIWVFHDQEKAWRSGQVALPKLIEKFLERGYEFECIPEKL